jgi:hypothetical protein
MTVEHVGHVIDRSHARVGGFFVSVAIAGLIGSRSIARP